jgi:hypothetical protein
MFGLRKMADGAIRNQPWCRPCRSGASSKKKREDAEQAELETQGPVEEAPATGAEVHDEPSGP